MRRYSIVVMIPYKELEQHTGLEPVPPVWKTGMLGHYTNATHSGSSLSRVRSSQGGPPLVAVDSL